MFLSQVFAEFLYRGVPLYSNFHYNVQFFGVVPHIKFRPDHDKESFNAIKKKWQSHL